jgi:transcriptional regulator with XRE-family HTH domain
MDVYTFGELLKAFRKRQKLSQQELARRMGKHINTIGTWERGDCLPDTKSTVLELAKELRLNEQETRQLLEASLIALSPYWNVPYQRNPFFTGRVALLERLHQQLCRERAGALSQMCALSGLGGIGKTQLALEYVYQYAQEYHVVFWIAAETYESLVLSFVAVARQLQLPEAKENDPLQVVKAALHWFSTHRDWLLVFDNVENVSLLKSFLPTARQSALLITTRLHSLDGLAPMLEVSPLSPEEGLHFLLRRAGLIEPGAPLESVPVEQLCSARALVEAMDGLPLALDQAGAYIEDTGCSLADYLALFQSSPVHLLDERAAHVEHPLSVSKTFALAFEQLERHNSAAAELLIVCAFLAPDAIPETLFIEGASSLGSTLEELSSDPLAFQHALKALLSFSLIQRKATAHTLTIHRLVQVMMRERLSETARRNWETRVLLISIIIGSARNCSLTPWHASDSTINRMRKPSLPLRNILLSISLIEPVTLRQMRFSGRLYLWEKRD